ncbi:MAG: hypothetical protein J7M14_07850 [Planctomycetes bacterium]|nr:hypothetical protein [Planctomycetota bacterium]
MFRRMLSTFLVVAVVTAAALTAGGCRNKNDIRIERSQEVNTAETLSTEMRVTE